MPESLNAPIVNSPVSWLPSSLAGRRGRVFLVLFVGVGHLHRALAVHEADRECCSGSSSRSCPRWPEWRNSRAKPPMLGVQYWITFCSRRSKLPRSCSAGGDAGDRQVAPEVGTVAEDLVRRIPTAHDEAAPATLQADAAVAGRERGGVRLGVERGLELEEGLEATTEIFGAANAEAARTGRSRGCGWRAGPCRPWPGPTRTSHRRARRASRGWRSGPWRSGRRKRQPLPEPSVSCSSESPLLK